MSYLTSFPAVLYLRKMLSYGILIQGTGSDGGFDFSFLGGHSERDSTAAEEVITLMNICALTNVDECEVDCNNFSMDFYIFPNPIDLKKILSFFTVYSGILNYYCLA